MIYLETDRKPSSISWQEPQQVLSEPPLFSLWNGEQSNSASMEGWSKVAPIAIEPDAIEVLFLELISDLSDEGIQKIEQRCSQANDLYQIPFSDLTQSPLIYELINVIHFQIESQNLPYSPEIITQIFSQALESPRRAYYFFVREQSRLLHNFTLSIDSSIKGYIHEAMTSIAVIDREAALEKISALITQESVKVFANLLLRKLWQQAYTIDDVVDDTSRNQLIGISRRIDDFFELAYESPQDALHLLYLQQSAACIKEEWLGESMEIDDLVIVEDLVRSLHHIKNTKKDFCDTAVYLENFPKNSSPEYSLLCTVNKIQKLGVFLPEGGSLQLSVLHIPKKERVIKGSSKRFYRGVDANTHRPVASLIRRSNRDFDFAPLTYSIAELEHLTDVKQYDTLSETEKRIYLSQRGVPNLPEIFAANDNMITEEIFSSDATYFLERYRSCNEARAYEKIFSNIKLILSSTLASIESLHALDIIHADVRTENLLVEYDETFVVSRCSLTDFGLSGSESFQRRLKQLRFPAHKNSIRPYYFSPEIMQASEECITFSADLFGYGVLIAELLLYHLLKKIHNSHSAIAFAQRHLYYGLKIMNISSFSTNTLNYSRIGNAKKDLQQILGDKYNIFDKLLQLAGALVKERPEERLTVAQTKLHLLAAFLQEESSS